MNVINNSEMPEKDQHENKAKEIYDDEGTQLMGKPTENTLAQTENRAKSYEKIISSQISQNDT